MFLICTFQLRSSLSDVALVLLRKVSFEGEAVELLEPFSLEIPRNIVFLDRLDKLIGIMVRVPRSGLWIDSPLGLTFG